MQSANKADFFKANRFSLRLPKSIYRQRSAIRDPSSWEEAIERHNKTI